MNKYFLSYSRADQVLALAFARDLRAAGADVWVDQIDIQPSDRWDRSVEHAVRDCLGVILIMSPRAVASENVMDEVSVALDAGKHVIPVLIEPCQAPLRLARVQFIDATHDVQAAVTRCVSVMRGSTAQAKADEANRVAVAAVGPAPGGRDANQTPAGFSAALFAALSTRLTPILGPIARHLVEDEARRASSHSDLVARLGARIDNATERAKFLAAARDITPG